MYDWLLFFHILAAMVWLGGVAVLGGLGRYLVRSGDTAATERFVRSLRVIGPTTLAPSVVALLGFGIWLVADSDAWDFGQGWILTAFVLFAGAFVVGAAFQSRAAISAQSAAEAGDYAELRRQLGRWTTGMWIILALLILATWDMVMKPGL